MSILADCVTLSSDPLDYYEQHGFSLLECKPKSKVPSAGYSWKAHSSSDRAEWDNWPAQGNIGIDAAKSGLLLIDVDVSVVGQQAAWKAYVLFLRGLGIAEPRKPGDPFMPQTRS